MSRWLRFYRADSIVGRRTLVPLVVYLLRSGLGDDVSLRRLVFHLSPVPFLTGRLYSLGRLEEGEPSEERCEMMTSL